MPDDEQPQPPNKNPFIRFKQHVDDRIGTGLLVLTGRQPKLPPMAGPQYSNLAAQDVRSSSMLNMNSPNNTTYWEKWAVASPYAPYNLQHLPQPVPKDLPSDVAADHFGFEDALEDLLATTQGLPMMDLRQQAAYKSAVCNAFKSWKEPPVVWAERVAARGLWSRAAVLPTSTEGKQNADCSQQQLHRPESVDEWLAERTKRAEARHEPVSDDMGSSLVAMLNEWMRDATDHLDRDITLNLATMIRQAARDLGKNPDSPDTEEWVRDFMKKLDKDFIFNPAGVLRQMEQVAEEVSKESAEAARELEALYHIERAKVLAQEKEESAKEAEQAENKEEEEGPWSDNDLFAAIEGAIAEADRSFGNFAKAITDTAAKSEKANTDESTGTKSPSWSSWPPVGWEKAAAQIQDKNERGDQKNEEVIETSGPYGGKTIRSTTQHVDAFGYVHQKIEVKTLDRDGNEVSRESRYSVQPASTGRQGIASPDDSHQNVDQERAGKHSSGWFWR